MLPEGRRSLESPDPAASVLLCLFGILCSGPCPVVLKERLVLWGVEAPAALVAAGA